MRKPEDAAPASAPVQPEAAPRDTSTLCDARDAFQALVETIWRLRQPDGCPWDRKQTHASIAKNMIEEAYEAVDCIESEDVAHLREELGDVLMQVVLHAQIAADAGEF
ncbi:nucleoside triphosphate pyrophosphohydrolase, partial [Bifidobacterium pullorum subsp. saeculare]|nr:nucleoside triphosphate pyrophosphohydrolase [Bifidobacterium pullorum subsp. saeculare]